MEDKLWTHEIIEIFKEEPQISSAELRNFYKLREPDLKDSTINWRIWWLKENGVISSIKKGMYVLRENKEHSPTVSRQVKRISNQIKKNFPYTNYSIWDTEWLNEYMIHQPGNFTIIVEVEESAVSAVYTTIQGIMPNVFIYPLAKDVMRLINSSDKSIVVKQLVSRSPIREFQKVKIPKLEKILVDLFIDDELFIEYQGEELINIFNSVSNQHVINFTTLFSYAARRNNKENIKKFMIDKTNIKPDIDLLEVQDDK